MGLFGQSMFWSWASLALSEMSCRVVVKEIVLLHCSILLSSEPSGRASLLQTA